MRDDRRLCSTSPLRHPLTLVRRAVPAVLLVPALLLTLPVRCSEEPTGPESVARVTVAPDTSVIWAAWDTVRLVATAWNSSGEPVPGVPFAWASSRTFVATVGDSGLVQARAEGTATVTATVGNAVGSALVRVVIVGSVEIEPSLAGLRVAGDTVRLAAAVRTVSGSQAEDPPLDWASSDTSVARVDGDGLVTAVGAGHCGIVAAAGTHANDTATVVVEWFRVRVTPGGLSLSGQGSGGTLAAEYRDGQGVVVPGKTFTWESLNPNVATVDGSGVVRAVGAGQAVIAATTEGMTGYALATVSIPEAPAVNAWVPMAGSPRGTGVWGTSATDVYVAGGTGLWRWDGATWTKVADGSFGGVWGASATGVFAVGSGGLIVRYDGRTATPMSSGTTANLVAVWGSSPRDVYAQSCPQRYWRDSRCSPKVLLHWDGTEWATISTEASGNGIWGTSASDVYATGVTGWRHWDGASWSSQSSTDGLDAVGGTSPADVHLAGCVRDYSDCRVGGGVAWRRNGGAWERDTGNFWGGGVWASSPRDVYMVGGWILDPPGSGCRAGVRHWDGEGWSETQLSESSCTGAVWGTTPTEVFAAGSNGVYRGVAGTVTVAPAAARLTGAGQAVQLAATLRDTRGNVVGGTTWEWTSSDFSVADVDTAGLVTAVAGGTATISARIAGGAGQGTATVTVAVPGVRLAPVALVLTGSGATGALTAEVVDEGGAVVPGAAVAWSSLNPAVATVDAAGVVTAVAAGQATIAASANGVTAYTLATVSIPGGQPASHWEPVASGTTSNLHGVWGADAASAFAVGWLPPHTAIVRFDGVSWAPVASGTTEGSLRSIWGASSTDALAVGAYENTLHWDGSTWTAAGGGVLALDAVWGTSPREAFAVGFYGEIVRWDGATWHRMTSPTNQALWGVWGTSSRDAWAVGYRGAILRWDGSEWRAVTSGTTATLNGVWGTSPEDVYAVGSDGVILHWGGSAWTSMSSGITTALYAVWGTSSTNVIAVGKGGVILRWNGVTWAPESSGTTANLRGIWGTSVDRVFVVGDGGTILRGVR